MAASRMLFVVYAERIVDYDPETDETSVRYRIISARKAAKREQDRYYRQAGP